MYYYALGGYLVYKAYEYSSTIEYMISIGKGVKHMCNWIIPSNKKHNDEYIDWILIMDDKNSLF